MVASSAGHLWSFRGVFERIFRGDGDVTFADGDLISLCPSENKMIIILTITMAATIPPPRPPATIPPSANEHMPFYPSMVARGRSSVLSAGCVCLCLELEVRCRSSLNYHLRR
jgi:hypothetical protein